MKSQNIATKSLRHEESTSLFDDRKERPGVKFAEADLIGIPHRLVIGEKGAKDNLIEYLTRSSKEMVKFRQRKLSRESLAGTTP